jgi:DNA-binding response OmpR family regulator
VALRRSKRDEGPGGGGGSRASRGGPPRVLIVNDEPDACELLARLLVRAGNEVERARTFTEMADRLVLQPRLDCLVLDISAGGIGGNLKLLDAVRGFHDEAVAATPVVLITHGRSSAMFSWQSGVDELLVRPFQADELVQAVSTAIARPADERPKHRRRQLDAARTATRR